MLCCGNETHSVPCDVLLERERNVYQCYVYCIVVAGDVAHTQSRVLVSYLAS